MTTKLFYENAYTKEFEAVVTAVRTAEDGSRWVELDRTAFFPEAGGQTSDTGVLSVSREEGGEVLFRVTDVQSEGEADVVSDENRIWHRLEAGAPKADEASAVKEGDRVLCRLDWETRFAKMQIHTAEHILCGIAHAEYGAENVGFHVAVSENGEEPAGEVTFDLDKPLSEAELMALERKANDVVRANRRVNTLFPEPEELAARSYRAKLDLTGDVRLVEIEGVDCCACCAPHVAATGEIGLIKLLGTERYKGGVRIHMKAGTFAFRDYAIRYEQAARASVLLNCPQGEIVPAIEARFRLEEAARERRIRLEEALIAARVREVKANLSGGTALLFEDVLDADSVRRIINETVSSAKLVAVFTPAESSEKETAENAYRYIVGSAAEDLRPFAKELNGALNGKGGGRPEMIQGSCVASREEIKAFFIMHDPSCAK